MTLSTTSLEDQIASLTATVHANRASLDDATRVKALKAAKGLVEALGSPPETVIQDVVLVRYPCLRTPMIRTREMNCEIMKPC